MCILQKLAMSPSVQLSKTKVAEYDECSTKSYDSDHSEVIKGEHKGGGTTNQTKIPYPKPLKHSNKKKIKIE